MSPTGFHFLTLLSVAVPFLINTLSSSCFELILAFCAHFSSFVGPVLHLKIILIVRISTFVVLFGVVFVTL